MRIQNRLGFSLIEVNLAIFVISIGMLTLFSLFPAGLRQVESSQAATQEALFADYVLSTIRANAGAFRSEEAPVWVDLGQFRTRVMQGTGISSDSGVRTVPFGAADQFMRAEVTIGAIGNSRRSITLWCKAGEDGPTDYSVSIGSRD